MAIMKLKTFFLLILLIRRCACLKLCCQACSCAGESWLVSFLTGCRKEESNVTKMRSEGGVCFFPGSSSGNPWQLQCY